MERQIVRKYSIVASVSLVLVPVVFLQEVVEVVAVPRHAIVFGLHKV